MSGIGILAFGSLKVDPGTELAAVTERRIPTKTPFPVEFGRYSRSRGNGPTVVPHPQGAPVDAEVLVLAPSVSLKDATDMLYRREINAVGSSKEYRESSQPTSLLIADQPGFCELDHVLYADFRDAGKIPAPTVAELAKAAVDSVAWAPQRRDGISYLIEFLEGGVKTPLTRPYEQEILVLTGTATLADALDVARLKL